MRSDIEPLRRQSLGGRPPQQMAHGVRRPGESGRGATGPAADDDHQALPVEILIPEPADDPVSNVEEDQAEVPAIMSLMGTGTSLRVNRIEIVIAEVVEVESYWSASPRVR